MLILGIETSCDETAISLLEYTSGTKPRFTVGANNVLSQIDIHKEFGGVFPMMAKREHAKNIIPILQKTLQKNKLLRKEKVTFSKSKVEKIRKILERENGLFDLLFSFISTYKKPNITKIAVTVGPGLEPALWVGISTARALSLAWDIPLVPVNHMEGHILSVVTKGKKTFTIDNNIFPALSLLVSGGHTELVLVNKIGSYKLIGETVDDAAGEAFDKVARMLGLSYPGGPEISKRAQKARIDRHKHNFSLPRPMIHTPNLNFSFSGLKTAVLYLTRGMKNITEIEKNNICMEFENAVVEVLCKKTLTAVKKYKVKSIIVGGGVAANKHLKSELAKSARVNKIPLFFPDKTLTTDNALMIAIAGYFGKPRGIDTKSFKASGNMNL